MRQKTISKQGLQVKAISGTYVVLLGFNVSEKIGKKKDFLGFSIHRTDHTENESHWLKGMLHFPIKNGEAVKYASNVSPFQKFRWGDYTAKPKHQYTYTVQAIGGQPGALKVTDEVKITISTHDTNNIGKRKHQIHFNRSAAASQAYVKMFGDKDPDEVPNGQAYKWLSRGLEESLIEFIKRAKDKNYSLHLCIYEFQKDSFLQALKEAVARGVKVQIIYDAIENERDTPRGKNINAIKKHKLHKHTRPRASIHSISHNKFIVLSKNEKPIAVWTGSTNFTDGAIYGQANVGHAVEDKNIAKQYYDLHQKLHHDPELKISKVNAEQLSPISNVKAGLYPIFSPRKDTEALTLCADFIKKAKNMVCFTLPFKLHADIQNELDDNDDKFIKLGLINRADNVVEKVKHTMGNSIALASRLETKLDQFQRENFHHRGIFIHTKYFIIDPLSDNPIVITGSANFSKNSSVNNDENQLVIIGETEVADVYLGEFMRMFDHYAFRHFADKTEQKKASPHLTTDNEWAVKYFRKDSMHEKERLAFSK